MRSKPKNPAHQIHSVKAKALSAAAEILACQSVDDLNLRAIAGRAGIGIASIYHYFSNKEELLLNIAIVGFGDLQRNIISFQ
jgi:AcrR family transcriptional regulator